MHIEKSLRTICGLCRTNDRLDFIKANLQTHTIDNYQTDLYNVYAPIMADKPSTIALTVHHDLVNLGSENCLDNNASLINLISIYQKALANKDNLKYNLVFAFVDAEETVNMSLSGIGPLLQKHSIDQLIDLELTAGGTNIIQCTYGQYDLTPFDNFRMPYNNAYIAGRLQKCKGSACITLVSDEDIKQLHQYGSCDRWSCCHNDNDTIKKWANFEEMQIFTDKMIQLLT